MEKVSKTSRTSSLTNMVRAEQGGIFSIILKEHRTDMDMTSKTPWPEPKKGKRIHNMNPILEIKKKEKKKWFREGKFFF